MIPEYLMGQWFLNTERDNDSWMLNGTMIPEYLMGQ